LRRGQHLSIQFRAKKYDNASKSPTQLKMNMIIRARPETIYIVIESGAYAIDRGEVNLVYKEGLFGSLVSRCDLKLQLTTE
jgi:hypothetical protein